MAYDFLKDRHPERGHKEYLQILNLAAKESESGVEDAIRWLLTHDHPISAAGIESILKRKQTIPPVTDVQVSGIDLSLYDNLLEVVNG